MENKYSAPLAFLGLPFLGEEHEAGIYQIIRKIHADQGCPVYYRWVNAFFFSHTYPEIVHVIQKRGFALVGDAEINLFFRALAAPVTERSDLTSFLNLLSKELKRRELSVLALCEQDSDLQLLGEKLVAVVETEGEGLAHAIEHDTLILEKIEQSKPDLLILCFEGGKAELWLERVFEKLHVPVILSIPKKTREGILSFFPFFFSACAFSFYFSIHSLFSPVLFRKQRLLPPQQNLLFLSKPKTIVIVSFPELLSGDNVSLMNQWFQEALEQDIVIVDFQNLRQLSFSGISLIFHFWLQAKREGKVILGLGMRFCVRRLFQLGKLWDVLKRDCYSNLDELVSCLEKIGFPKSSFDSIQQSVQAVVVTHLGALQQGQLTQNMEQMLQGKDCIMDLRYCTKIESSGFCFLLTLLKHQQSQGKKLAISGLTRKLKRQFQRAKLIDTFQMEEH